MQQNRICICGAEFKPRTFLSKHCQNNRCFNLFMDNCNERRRSKERNRKAKAKA